MFLNILIKSSFVFEDDRVYHLKIAITNFITRFFSFNKILKKFLIRSNL